jgi:uncharacterized membrane protein YeaQ/YmgE (transglycosylase-associated protein family)
MTAPYPHEMHPRRARERNAAGLFRIYVAAEYVARENLRTAFDLPRRRRRANHRDARSITLFFWKLQRNGRKRMGILSWIIVGLVAGVLAKMVVPGEGPGGIIGDMIVGIVGAFIGGWIFNFFGHTGLDGFTLWSVIVAFVGSVVLLFILRALTGGRRTVV